MKIQSVQTRIHKLSGQTVTTRQDAITLLEQAKLDQHQLISLCCSAIKNFSNIGDACRHSAHIPEVTGQGGTL